MGLKTNKNYIIINAVNNILSSPAVAAPEIKFNESKNYGVTPKYLHKRK